MRPEDFEHPWRARESQQTPWQQPRYSDSAEDLSAHIVRCPRATFLHRYNLYGDANAVLVPRTGSLQLPNSPQAERRQALMVRVGPRRV